MIDSEKLYFYMNNTIRNQQKKSTFFAASTTASKNVTLSLNYRCSKRAWMTADIFEEWFHNSFVPEVTTFLIHEGLPVKAVLILDNAPCHPKQGLLKTECGSIFVLYMPPNVTPLLQPMDQNVIRLTKLHYRTNLLKSSNLSVNDLRIDNNCANGTAGVINDANQPVEASDEDEDEDEHDEINGDKCTIEAAEAIKIFDKAIHWTEHNTNSLEHITFLNNIGDIAVKKSLEAKKKQSTILDFFK
ncbi:tigger transposable element-derived protein 2-like [Anastrepha ludens]|uniref:tigger transposable element-derived protein 2-like n=1 Tax=Anastrepha ludens TaxID=28586 RepID=UPI0023AF8041|nr:tigger transposable element-derived protein 2-like [Anastrepha ludens]